jgi:serine/threonine protein kinase
VTLKGISAPQQIGRYEILDEIGRGAMGVVFKARDPFIGRLVAVKTITTGIADKPDLLERFRREAQAAGGLQHPNIVTIYEMSEFDGTPFIAMEYLEGASLEKTISEQSPLPLVDKLGYIVQACRALDYANRRGVIHRDIKPANIMVTSEGVVKVVDFGIARIIDAAKTQTGVMLGTLSYMSPELVRGRRADQRCDVWALGVVMYELLTYRRPFDGENHAAVLMSILQQEPRPIQEFLPECPPALETVVQRALRKEESLRYPTMEAMLVDLEPVWTSQQKETVQKMVIQGRELMEGGRLEEAIEVLRKALSIDTGNATAKTLFDRVNAVLGTNSKALPENKRATEDQNPILAAFSSVEKQSPEQARNGTLAATGGFDAPLKQLKDPTAAKATPSRSATMPSRVPNIRSTAASQMEGTRRPRSPILAIAIVIALLMLGLAGYRKFTSRHDVADELHFKLPPPAPPIAEQVVPPTASSAATSAEGPATPTVLAPSIEDQQRHLIDEAHQAAGSKDFKTARTRLDEAAKLNGPLNSLIADLRHEFSDQARNAEARLGAQQEQSLWARAMKDFEAGHLDESEEQLREILAMPEAGQHWEDAAKYVDEEIPVRRRQEQLWTRAQQEASLTGSNHRISEVKILDQVLAIGGTHQQQARQRRDFIFSQFARDLRRRNNAQDSVISASEQAQFPHLKDAVDKAVTQGDAKALEQLQGIRPRFKSVLDGGGPLISDARDYMNNILPRAQRVIEAKLADMQADTLSNEKFRDAAKEFDQAVAAQDATLLRTQIKSDFQVIANSGGPRTKEAERYIIVLIPEALKKITR